jgi:hypothetical protein
MNDNISKLKTMIDDKFKEMLKNLEKEINERLKDLTINKEDKNLDGENLKLLKDLSKRVIELEKHFKLLSNSINVEAINKEIARLNDLIYKRIIRFKRII